jgi:hypothetical protein
VLVMQFVFREIVEKTQSRPSVKLGRKMHSRPNKKLVGKACTIGLLVGYKCRLGKRTSDENSMLSWSEKLSTVDTQLVSKNMLVGKDLYRPDLR